MAGLYKDRSHRTKKDQVKRRPCDLKYTYKREETTAGTPPQWITQEKEHNAKFRKTHAIVAR